MTRHVGFLDFFFGRFYNFFELYNDCFEKYYMKKYYMEFFQKAIGIVIGGVTIYYFVTYFYT